MPPPRLDPPLAVLIAATLLVAAALALRLAALGWDELAGLHPDERHMIFVGHDMLERWRAAEGVGLRTLWFAPDSPLNPRLEGRSYVYGEFPLLAMVLAAAATGTEGWFEAMGLGRHLTALVDASTVLAVFLLGWTLARRAGPALLAAGLYALAPTALQLAVFFTVDAWLVAAMSWSVLGMVALANGRGAGVAAGAGLAAGLALACKITAGVLLLPALLALWASGRRAGAWTAVRAALAGLAAAAVSFRLANPFAFAGPGPFGLAPSPQFRADLADLVTVSTSPGFPPNWQWMAGYPLPALMRDMVLFGSGPALTLAALAGLGLLAWRWRAVSPGLGVVLAALAGVAISLPLMGHAIALRYLAPALPLLAVVAAVGLAGIAVPLWRGAALALTALALWWGAGTAQTLMAEHPRLAASRWLWQQPAGTTIANETAWDEGLPVITRLPGEAERRWPGHDGHFRFLSLDITDPDSPDKAARLARLLDETDLLAISSGRQRDVMPRLPARFPMTTVYYRLLAAGALCFERVWSGGGRFLLPGWPLADGHVQEPWHVYTHPRVEIFRRMDCHDPARTEALLRDALPEGFVPP